MLASLIARAIGKLDFKDNDTNAVRILYLDFFRGMPVAGHGKVSPVVDAKRQDFCPKGAVTSVFLYSNDTTVTKYTKS